jgi:malonyl-CoA O-methyltransferase
LNLEGRFVFSLFGEGTLYELRESWHQALLNAGRGTAEQHTGAPIAFMTVHQVRQALDHGRFQGYRQGLVELEQVWYPDVPHLLQAIKRIGAGTARPPVRWRVGVAQGTA